jgi:uncharacterized membrane protein
MTTQRIALPAVVLVAAMATITTPIAQADNAGAFIGGMLAGKVLRNMDQRTQAEQQQAYYAQQQAQQVQQAPPPPAQKTTQQKLDELDKLAAGGYITPDEYKAKKQQILDSM